MGRAITRPVAQVKPKVTVSSTDNVTTFDVEFILGGRANHTHIVDDLPNGQPGTMYIDVHTGKKEIVAASVVYPNNAPCEYVQWEIKDLYELACSLVSF